MSMKLSPDHPLSGVALTVGNFWSWAYSDILSNRNRGIFAEFFVGAALGVLDSPRIEWDSYDLVYRSSKIEVKCSSYLQSWEQVRPSQIVFSVKASQLTTPPQRSADCYVFCLFATQDRDNADVLNVAQWEFYVVHRSVLGKNEKISQQQSIRLSTLRSVCSTPVGFHDLKAAINQVLNIEG